MAVLSPDCPFLELALQADLPDRLGALDWVQEVLTYPWQKWCALWLERSTADLPSAPGYEFSLCLTDDPGIQQLNHQFRQQARPTDVLAFAALEVPSPLTKWEELGEPLYLGDIVISLERAQCQAEERQHPPPLEVIWLASHGLLHLLGWDHPDPQTLTTMLSRQSYLLEQIGKNPPHWP